MITRYAPLFFGLILGIALGLLYGWLIQPSQYTGASPDVLREDYVVDYVLMIAQAFENEQDLDQAKRRLSFLGPQKAETYLLTALSYAQEHDFKQTDISQLRQLADIFVQRSPSPAVSPP